MPLPISGHRDFGQYRISFTPHGPYVEIFIAENEHRAGHWRLVGGNKRDALLRTLGEE
jgi:hypothetical protein